MIHSFFRIGSRLEAGGSSSLRFNSQFESGNLRKAIWVGIHCDITEFIFVTQFITQNLK